MTIVRNIYLFLIAVFVLGVWFKYPHINPDGLLYIDNAIKFDGSFSNINKLYGLPAYSVFIFYINKIFNNFHFAIYFINIACYLIMIFLISNICNLLFKKRDYRFILIALFLSTSLMAAYLGLAIRDYIGWTLFILAFYYSLQYSIKKNNKSLFIIIISLFFGSFFRIEFLIYALFIPVLLILKYNKFNLNIIFSAAIIFSLGFLLVTFFYLINDRSIEIMNHAESFFSNLVNFQKINLFSPFYFISIKLIKVFPYIFYILFFLFICNYFINKKNYYDFAFKNEYLYCFFIFSILTFFLGYIYYLNSNVFSSRYFVPILLISIPYFIYLYIYLSSINRVYKNFINFFIFLSIVINIYSNYKYIYDAEKNAANFLLSKGIATDSVFIIDNRILFYMGYLTIEKKSINKNLLQNYKFLVLSRNELDQIGIDIDNSCYNLEAIPVDDKFYLIEKKDSC